MAGNRWVRLDTGYFRNPKTVAAGRDGRDLHLASICWVADQLTDGIIPAQVVPMICRDAGVDAFAVDLAVAAGLWIPNGGASFELHDFVEMNGSRSDVMRERAQWRERQRRYRAARHGETAE